MTAVQPHDGEAADAWPATRLVADAGAQRRPVSHFCKITLEVMRDPVVLPCGDVFDRAAITAWLASRDGCPFCWAKTGRATDVAVPNLALRAAIEGWRPLE